ncbi:MAG: hypothetical protein VX307_07955, partial [Chloroflexota bacterium]|nr:hypothetical protein [Chloroflexota bacterium]
MLSSNVVTESSKTTATTVQVFSDNVALIRGEKHEGGGFGLLVLGMNHPHQERSQKCLRTTSIKG